MLRSWPLHQRRKSMGPFLWRLSKSGLSVATSTSKQTTKTTSQSWHAECAAKILCKYYAFCHASTNFHNKSTKQWSKSYSGYAKRQFEFLKVILNWIFDRNSNSQLLYFLKNVFYCFFKKNKSKVHLKQKPKYFTCVY